MCYALAVKGKSSRFHSLYKPENAYMKKGIAVVMNVDQNRLQLIIQRLGMPGELLIQSLQDIKEQSFIERQDLLAANPDWKRKTDIRLTSFGKIINICDRTQFSIDILGNMLDDDWCRENINNNLRSDSGYKTALAVEFEKATKFGFGISIFTIIEYSLRIFLRSLDSSLCNGGTATFDAIYHCLLGSKQLNYSTNDRAVIEQMLDLVRNIRNLIHNDGVYYNDKGINAIVTYRCIQYQFINGKPANFVTWDLLLNLAEDIFTLLQQTIHHPKIAKQDQIIDPYEICIWQVP